MSFRTRLLPVAATGVLVLAGLAASSSPAAAAPPGNDDFANAVDIGYTAASGSNVEATYETGEPQPSCTVTEFNGSAESSIWYRFTAPATEDVSMDTLQSESSDTEIAVYTGSAVDGLTEVACNDDVDPGNNNFRSQLTMGASQGAVYYVQVSTWTGDDGLGGTAHNQGGLVLTVGPAPAGPPNDGIQDAQVIDPGNYFGTTVNATVDEVDAIASGISGCDLTDTIWYGYLPTSDGNAVVDLAGSNFDTALVVLDTDPVGQTTELAGCNDDNGLSQTSRVAFPVVAGHQYIFQVGTMSGQEGDVELTLDSTAGGQGDPAVSGKASKAPGTQVKYEVKVKTDATGGSAGGELTLRAPKGVKVEGVGSATMSCAKTKPIVCTVPALPASGQSSVTVLVTPGSEGPFKLKASYVDGVPVRPAASRSVSRPPVSLFPRVDDPANNTRTITASTAVVCDNKPSSKADKDSGGNGGDILCGLGGGDTLKGGGGADLIFGGDGGDTLLGGDGADQVYGGGGADDLVGGGGRDLLNGGGGTDGCKEKSDTQQSCEN